MSLVLLNLEKLCNALLREDPASFAIAQSLAGRTVALEISRPGLPLAVVQVQFTAQGVKLLTRSTRPADVRITANVATYLRLLLQPQGSRSPDMSIHGDVTLAQRFQQILGNLEIDWEEQLSHWIGDTAAHQCGRLFRSTRIYARDTGNTVSMDISEYLRYEKNLLPDREEVDEFITRVDQLRNDVERLNQRLERLYRQISS